MTIFIDNDVQMSWLQELCLRPCLLVPVYSDHQLHPAENTLCVVFVHFFDEEETQSFAINFSHAEMLKRYDASVLNMFQNNTKCYVHDKKSFLHHYPHDNLIDAGILKYYAIGTGLTDELNSAVQVMQRRFHSMKNLNRIVSLLKLLEWSQDLLHDALRYIQDLPACTVYDQEASRLFQQIESNGIAVAEHSELATKYLVPISNRMVYSQYNFFTLTSRPSNRFAGINFAALNKETEMRNSIVSRFDRGVLLQIDYESYHLRLLTDKVNYQIPGNSSIYDYLGQQYFGKSELTAEEYAQAKEITFQIIYGNRLSEFTAIELFQKINSLVNSSWLLFLRDKQIRTWYFDRAMKQEHFTDMNRNKLLNYLCQSAETERNCIIMNRFLNKLHNYKSKLILYTYDSFLIDVHPEEFAAVVELCRTDIGSDKYPIKAEIGLNFGNMKQLNLA